MEILFDQEEFVVIDNGTGFIKAGFSGQDLPRISIPQVVGEYIEPPPDEAAMQGATQADLQEEKKPTYAFGNAALLNRALARDEHKLFEPIKRGIIEDWDYM